MKVGAPAEPPEARTSAGRPHKRARGSLAHLSAVRLTIDALAVVIALVGAYVLRFELELLSFIEADPAILDDHVLVSGVWLAALLVTLIVNRLYDEDTLFRGGGETSRVFRSWVEAISVLSLFVFLTQTFAVSRSWFLFTASLSLTLLLAERVLVRSAIEKRRRKGYLRRPVVVVSREDEGQMSPLLSGDEEFNFLEATSPTSLLATLAEPKGVSRPYPEGTIVLLRPSEFEDEELWRVVVAAGEANLTVFISATVRSMSRDRLTVREVGGHTLVKISPPNLQGAKALQKRSLDLVLSLIGAILLAPVFAAIAIAVLFNSGRPVIYSQERVGRGGRRFRIHKFRTMAQDAEETSGPTWATANDPRPTSLGRALRRTSLDELPQLWNVIKGEMSLVGPRPERPVFVEDFSEQLIWYASRHRIRPGITGWAQSHGLRGQTSLSSRVEFDNWYIEHWSVALDLSILVKTLARMWSDRNAY